MSNEIITRDEATATTAIERDAPVAGAALPMFTLKEVNAIARIVVEGGLFPHLKTPEQAISLMLLCQAKGLHPMTAVERYDIVQGRPAMKAQAMQALFQQEGGRIEWHRSDDECCAATFTHPSGGSLRIEWTKKRADAAQLTGKDTWRKHPAQMLRARCVSEGVRAVLPGAVLGIYTPEETEEFAPAPGPAAAPAPARQVRDEPFEEPERTRRTPTPKEPSPEPIAPLLNDFRKAGEGYGFDYKGSIDNVKMHVRDLCFGNEVVKRDLTAADVRQAMELLRHECEAEPLTAEDAQGPLRFPDIVAATQAFRDRAGLAGYDMSVESEQANLLKRLYGSLAKAPKFKTQEHWEDALALLEHLEARGGADKGPGRP